MPCAIDISFIGDAPTLSIAQANGLTLHGQIAVDLKCKRHSGATEFSQVFTINNTPLDFTGKIEISKSLTVSIHIDDFSMNI